MDRSILGVQSASTGLTTSEAARLLSLSVSTIQAMVRDGALVAWRTEGGHRRIALDSVESWQRARGEQRATIEAASFDTRNARSGTALAVLLVGCGPDAVTGGVVRLPGLEAPIEYHWARDGCDALLLAERVRPDVLVVRHRLEPVDGLELVRRLRAHREFAQMLAVVLTEDGVRLDEGIERRPAGTLVVQNARAAERLRGVIEAQLLRRWSGGHP